MHGLWEWLKDDKNRDILKMAAAGFAALAVAAWTIITFSGGSHSPAGVSASGGGIAAGHDVSGNTINMVKPKDDSAASAAAPEKKK